MAFPRTGNVVRAMSIDASDPSIMFSPARASRMARRLLEAEQRPDREEDEIAIRVEQRWGIGFWQLTHLAKGRAKTCDVTLFGRLRAAYIELCERQVTKLQLEIEIEKALGDDDLEDLEREASALATKIQARKAALNKLRRP